MRKQKMSRALTAAIGLLTLAGTAVAQQGNNFDGRKFFEQLQSRGVGFPPGFDGAKFFEDLQSRGFTSQNKFDGAKFFEELQSRGFSIPLNFDKREFWEEQIKIGSDYMPPMIDAKR